MAEVPRPRGADGRFIPTAEGSEEGRNSEEYQDCLSATEVVTGAYEETPAIPRNLRNIAGTVRGPTAATEVVTRTGWERPWTENRSEQSERPDLGRKWRA